MLYFYCADPEEVKSIRDTGLSASGALLLATLDEAERQCTEKILVIDAFGVAAAGVRTDGAVRIPAAAVLNVDPYVRPKRVTAAGGFITRRREGVLELLMIFRRGAWDLPKGKLDKGESIEECALREVREETGIDNVKLGRPLGTTVHAYREKKRCMVKTTYWYEMSTGADEFTPQHEEDIEQVSWIPWRDAREVVGFETLRRHMDEVQGRL